VSELGGHAMRWEAKRTMLWVAAGVGIICSIVLAWYLFAPPRVCLGWMPGPRRALRVPPPDPQAFGSLDRYGPLGGLGTPLLDYLRSHPEIDMSAPAPEALRGGLEEALERSRLVLDALHRARVSPAAEPSRRGDPAEGLAITRLRWLPEEAYAAAWLEVRGGDPARAFGFLGDALTMCVDLLLDAPDSPVSLLAGVLTYKAVRYGDAVVLLRAAPEPALAAHAAEMRLLRERLGSPADVQRRQAARVCSDASGEPIGGWRYALLAKQAAMVRWMEDRLERLAEEMEKPAGDRDLHGFARRTDRDVDVRGSDVEGLLRGLDRDADHWFRLTAQFAATEAVAALERYRLREGAFPEALAGLTPELLPEPPIDPWTDQPLRYRREGDSYVLYSVGPDGVDDGGRMDPKTGGPDIVYVGAEGAR
jgi:hypothetical protein